MNTDRIRKIKSEIESLRQELWALEAEDRDAVSRHNVLARNIRKNDVYYDGDFDKWFGDVTEWAKFLKDKPYRHYATWNGEVYPIQDLMIGNLTNRVCKYEHIEK